MVVIFIGNFYFVLSLVGLIVLYNILNLLDMIRLYEYCCETSKPIKSVLYEYFVENYRLKNMFGKIILMIKHLLFSASIIFAFLYIIVNTTIYKAYKCLCIFTIKK